MEHCFLPFHIWLDKGNVSRNVQQYPVVMQGAWLDSQVRNASGNGGGILIGLLPIVSMIEPYLYALFVDDITIQLNEPGADYNSKSQRDREEWARFVSENYQHMLHTIFGSIRHGADVGISWICGDLITRVFFPGILIESLDYDEAVHYLCCRAASANFPCPRCLVHKSRLHEMSQRFTPRTSPNMKAALEMARSQPTATAKDEVLRNHGIHDIEVD
jgi:hypothetical protein